LVTSYLTDVDFVDSFTNSSYMLFIYRRARRRSAGDTARALVPHQCGASRGIILKSPDGATCNRLAIDHAGALVLPAIACPSRREVQLRLPLKLGTEFDRKALG